jgi:hypothetical protein
LLLVVREGEGGRIGAIGDGDGLRGGDLFQPAVEALGMDGACGEQQGKS